jgi:hypothetical protein
MKPMRRPLRVARRWRAPARTALSGVAPATLLAVVLLTSGAAASSHSRAKRADPPDPPGSLAVTIARAHPGPPVAGRYLGISFEASVLGQVAAYAHRGDFATLLRSLGPGVLRFGGVSADTRIAWTDARTRRPAWASEALRASDFVALRHLAEASGWNVLLTVGLAHFEPVAAAREVAAAKRALGPWLAGIEIGNEPDAYGKHGLRRLPWDFAAYDANVRAYRRAIARLAHGARVAGPGVSGSSVFERWGPREARAQTPFLLTGHHYPLGCNQLPAPSIERLLSAKVRWLETRSLGRYMAVSRATRIPFRMDEANSVSCGGRAGISNTFASALWATGYIAQSLSAGVAGLNLQGNPANCSGYSPVCAATAQNLTEGLLHPQPLWYSLLLTRNLGGARPLPTRVAAIPGTPAPGAQPPQPSGASLTPEMPGRGVNEAIPAVSHNVSVTSFATRDGSVRFVIVDYDPPGTPAAVLRLHLGTGFGAATVLEMQGASPEATYGVRLGGRPVAGDGSWERPANLPTVQSQAGVVTVAVGPSSAALVSAPHA